jgi:hypothetical protein
LPVGWQRGQAKLGDAALQQLSIFVAEGISLAWLMEVQTSHAICEIRASIQCPEEREKRRQGLGGMVIVLE